MERLTEKMDGTNQYRLKSGYGFRFRYADSKAQETIDKLAEYEDLEEQDKLLKLPCAVGDTVYRIYYPNSMLALTITKIEIYKEEIIIVDDSDYEYHVKDFGNKIFLAKEEAEAALSKLQK